MQQFDVVIVGGGPAGSSLAYQLHKQGISTCIIDRARFPREKLCGGLLTEKTVDSIERIYGCTDFPFERVTSSVSLFFGEQKLSNVTTQSRFFLITRRDFDYYLFDSYKKAGGTAFEEDTIKTIDQKEHILELQSGLKLQYSILVGADGANSAVRKFIAPTYSPNAICVEASAADDTINDEVCVFFTDSRSGYGWCFPKSNYYTVGMGGDTKWNRHIREAFTHFSEQIGKPIEKKSLRGAMVPYGKYVKRPYNNNIVLVGDAAGLVDPITGEGLYFAFRSSELASSAIIKCLRDNAPLKKTYGKEIKEIHKRINDANRFNNTFFSYPIKKRLLPLLHGKQNIIKYYCENLLSHYKLSYMAFPVRYFYLRWKRKHGKR